MKVIFHDDCLLHNPPYEILSGHVVPYFESPSRLQLIKETLKKYPSDQFELCNELDFDLDVKDCCLKVHTKDYLDYLETAYDEWVKAGGDEVAVFPETFPRPSLLFGKSQDVTKLHPIARAGLYCFDLSCPITKDTFKATLASTRVVLSAAKHLLSLTEHEGVFALCRPPGHHATPSLSGGYCFINNVAVATRFLQDSVSVSALPRIAILDIDYHHGNGSQKAFYEDSTVLYVSLHAQDDYPYFSGSADEIGEGDGRGFNINYPLSRGTGDNDYCSTLTQATRKIIDFDPLYVLVSLGVDTHEGDPISEFKVTTHGYGRIGGIIATINKPTLFVMEGGYNLECIGQNVCNVLLGFQGEEFLRACSAPLLSNAAGGKETSGNSVAGDIVDLAGGISVEKANGHTL